MNLLQYTCKTMGASQIDMFTYMSLVELSYVEHLMTILEIYLADKCQIESEC